MLGHRHKWPWRENRDSHAWAKVFRIVPELVFRIVPKFRILELTFLRKSTPQILNYDLLVSLFLDFYALNLEFYP